MEIKTSLSPASMPVIDQNAMAAIVDQLMTHVVNVQKAKGGEYSGSKNALAYFQTLGIDTEVTPEKVVWIFLNKHLGSIRSYLNNLNYSVDGHDQLVDSLPVLSEPIEGRIVDAITYLCLFAGLVQRRRLQEQHLLSPDKTLVIQTNPATTGVVDRSKLTPEQNQRVDELLALGDRTVDAIREEAASTNQRNELDLAIEPMADREAFTPAQAPTGPKEVSYDQIVQQPTRLTLATAGYGRFVRLLFDKDGNVVDPTQPGADIASSKRYRVVAQVNEHLVVIGEQGKVQTLDPATTACYFYTGTAVLPKLPVLGQELARGRRFAGIANNGSDWSGVAELTAFDTTEICHTEMDVIASEVNGG